WRGACRSGGACWPGRCCSSFAWRRRLRSWP
ncbi:MAG: hypothetical protein AVDCRST_MAG59-348, partial [uncultured Thermomicrobiales bacterium]